MQIQWHHSIADVDPEEWNALAATTPTPILNHEWLLHLEQSGSICADTGWEPRHLTVRDASGMVAAVPLYRRDQSWGEFVFDFAFADVAEQIQVPYYPKLVGMSPATPSTAFAPLVRPGREEELTAVIMDAVVRRCRDEGISVLQFNYVLPRWRGRLERHGMTAWEHQSFQWSNDDFATFDDYLAQFRKGQRRNIRRERASLEHQGLTTAVVPGDQAPELFYHRMGEYYRRTNRQFGPWGAEFLTSAFFSRMPPEVRRHIWFAAAFTAEEPEDPVALALLVRREDHLLGRYWGARETIRDLHFNLCYYLPMEWSIAEGIRLFDPGMGSEHKVRRGFRSVPALSMHRFFDPQMDAILRANMPRINRHEQAQMDMLNQAIPIRSPQ